MPPSRLRQEAFLPRMQRKMCVSVARFGTSGRRPTAWPLITPPSPPPSSQGAHRRLEGFDLRAARARPAHPVVKARMPSHRLQPPPEHDCALRRHRLDQSERDGRVDPADSRRRPARANSPTGSSFRCEGRWVDSASEAAGLGFTTRSRPTRRTGEPRDPDEGKARDVVSINRTFQNMSRE